MVCTCNELIEGDGEDGVATLALGWLKKWAADRDVCPVKQSGSHTLN
jgi:hypothetical protein